jgi:hypothetical protein
MRHFEPGRYTFALIASALATFAAGPATAAAASSGHFTFAGIQRYLIASRQQEIALARSAAPRSVSMHATVMVLTAHGYITAAKGSNGFVCAVTRSWDNIATADSATFWDPRISVPKCFNPASARSVLPEYLLKTQWVLAGASESTIGERVTAGLAAGKIRDALGCRRPGALAPACDVLLSQRTGAELGRQSKRQSHLLRPRERAHHRILRAGAGLVRRLTGAALLIATSQRRRPRCSMKSFRAKSGGGEGSRFCGRRKR